MNIIGGATLPLNPPSFGKREGEGRQPSTLKERRRGGDKRREEGKSGEGGHRALFGVVVWCW